MEVPVEAAAEVCCMNIQGLASEAAVAGAIHLGLGTWDFQEAQQEKQELRAGLTEEEEGGGEAMVRYSSRVSVEREHHQDLSGTPE